MCLYSSKKLAYQALLCAMANRFAKEMRTVEKEMENDLP
jgi:hypothetical protein